MSDPMKNRRKHVRIYRSFILFFRLKSKSDARHEVSQVNNISQGGINFSSTIKLDVNTELFIEVKTPFLSDKVELQGFVHECREKIPNLIYSVRVEFKDLTEQAKDVLSKIEQYSSQQG